MKRVIPPLKAVRYFESAADHESFSAAAEECHVSKGAISQQVRILEAYLGVPLFRKTGRRVALTDAGRRYHSAVRSALTTLERETVRLAGPRLRPKLRVTALPAIASMWLVPRLSEFQSRLNVDLEIAAEAEMVDFSRSSAQVGIRYGGAGADGEGTGKGLTAMSLGRDSLFPVCAPHYASDQGIASADDLKGCRLLHDTYWSDDWSRWLAAVGMQDRLGGDGQYFTHYSMAIDSARAGGGVAMGHAALVRDLLDRGELVRPLAPEISAVSDYYVVYPQSAAHLDYVKTFCQWVQGAFTAPA